MLQRLNGERTQGAERLSPKFPDKNASPEQRVCCCLACRRKSTDALLNLEISYRQTYTDC